MTAQVPFQKSQPVGAAGDAVRQGADVDSREVLSGASVRQTLPGTHAVQIEQPNPRIIGSAGNQQVGKFQVAVFEARAMQAANLPGQPAQVHGEPGAAQAATCAANGSAGIPTDSRFRERPR